MILWPSKQNVFLQELLVFMKTENIYMLQHFDKGFSYDEMGGVYPPVIRWYPYRLISDSYFS